MFSNQIDAQNEFNMIAGERLNKKYQGSIGDRSFTFTSHSVNGIIAIKACLENAARTFVYPVEARIDIEGKEMTELEAKTLLFEYVDAYFDEYLNRGQETYLTIDWANYEFDGITIQMRGQIFNEYLESLADKILAGEEIRLQ